LSGLNRDLFSRDSASYARFRPRYPAALFEWLATLPTAHRVAWDCATGSGQAASQLGPHFSSVIGTDASREQLREAPAAPNLSLCVCLAESASLATGSVDLVTVAQAFHWLDRTAFLAEVERVAVPGGNAALAVWGYGRLFANRDIEQVVRHFQDQTVGPYWPPERRQVDERYRGISLPIAEVAAPKFAIEARLTIEELVGYIGTWSAVTRYRADRGRDPLPILIHELGAAWGKDATEPHTITWPLFIRAGRITGSAG